MSDGHSIQVLATGSNQLWTTRWRCADSPTFGAIWQTTTNSGSPAEIGWKFGLVQIAGKICNYLANGPFYRGKLQQLCHSMKLQLFSLVDKISFICWSKPLWVCDMRRLHKKRGLVWFQRVLVDEVVQTRSLTTEVRNCWVNRRNRDHNQNKMRYLLNPELESDCWN